MMNRIFLSCLLLSLYSAGSSLSCRWLDHKFRQYNQRSSDLLDIMVNNSTNTTEDAELEVAFPHDLYTQASKASAGERLGFIVQSLEQMALLFEEAHNSTSWQEKTVEDFVNVVSRQADGLRSCPILRNIGSHNHKNKKLRMYFKRLSGHIERMDHSAEVWELIRKEIKVHLFRLNQLASSLLTKN
ncbi:interferon a3-like [Scomber scombrus]|uniref:interferon a3-like n=1 Tax=Scomber scombrus TaxID=13677 RepID=UPI002DDAB304|nr:interferon a3-like [Scomber scombrus]